MFFIIIIIIIIIICFIYQTFKWESFSSSPDSQSCAAL